MLVAGAMFGASVGCEPPNSVVIVFCRLLYLVAEFPWEVFPVVVSRRGEGECVQEADKQRFMAFQRDVQLHEDGGGGFGVFEASGEFVEAWSCGESGGVVDVLEGVRVSRLQAMVWAGQ